MSVMVEPAAAPAAQGCQAVEDIRRGRRSHTNAISLISSCCEDRLHGVLQL